MIRILTYKEIDRAEWSRLVQTSATGTWFQTPEAYEFFESMPQLFMPFVVGVASLQLPPEGRRDKPTPNPSLKGGESSAHAPSQMSEFVCGLNSRPFTEGQGIGYSFASVWGAHTADDTQYDLLKENAKANRKNPTEAESILWDMLKGNNIGLHFRRQHIILDYIVDFICIEKGLVIELDGGYHNDPEQAEYDKQRTAHLEKLGYTELRFTNEELLTNPDAVIAQIKEVAFSLPSLKGRGGDRLLLRGVCVGYVTVERNPIKQYFTRRAIVIGGPCLADDCTDEEVETLLEAVKTKTRHLQSLNSDLHETTHQSACMQAFRQPEDLSPIAVEQQDASQKHAALTKNTKNIFYRYEPIYIETRNFNSYEKWKGAFEKAGFEYKRHLNFHVDCTDKEKMWERLSENRKRQIKKQPTQTLPKGKAFMDVTEQDVREWYEILAELYKTKVKTPLWPVEFFLEFYRQKRGVYLLQKHNGKVIGGMMAVIMKPTPNPFLKEGEKEQPQNRPQNGAIYEWYICGLDAEYKESHPSVMATWAAMEYANTHGIARFDVMGAGEPGVPYGVRDFKAEFGGELVEHGRFVCVREHILYKIGTLAVKMMKS